MQRPWYDPRGWSGFVWMYAVVIGLMLGTWAFQAITHTTPEYGPSEPERPCDADSYCDN